MTLTAPRLADHLAEQVRSLIKAQQLKAGMRLPAERLLAAKMGVSRSSLREAIQKLISEGLLISRRGGGTYISAGTEPWSRQRIVWPLQDLVNDDPHYHYDILEARHAIEPSTAWYAAIRATPADKEKLTACFDASLAFQENDDSSLAAQADARFHLAIAEASHNIVLLQTTRGFFDLLQSSVMHSRQCMYTVPDIFSRLTNQHQQLLRSILAGDAEGAYRAAKEHLGFVHNTMKNLHEDEARQRRITRLPDEENQKIREEH